MGDVEVQPRAVAALLAQAAREGIRGSRGALSTRLTDSDGENENELLPPSPDESVCGRIEGPASSPQLSSSPSMRPASGTGAAVEAADRLLGWARRRNERLETERARLATLRAVEEIAGCTFAPVDLPSRQTYRRRPATAPSRYSPLPSPSPSAPDGGTSASSESLAAARDQSQALLHAAARAAAAAAAGPPSVGSLPSPPSSSSSSSESPSVPQRTRDWDARRRAKIAQATEARAAAEAAECTFSPRISSRARATPSRLPLAVLEAARVAAPGPTSSGAPAGYAAAAGSEPPSSSSPSSASASTLLLFTQAQARYAGPSLGPAAGGAPPLAVSPSQGQGQGASSLGGVPLLPASPALPHLLTPPPASSSSSSSLSLIAAALSSPTPSVGLRQAAEVASFVRRLGAGRAQTEALAAALQPRVPLPPASSSAAASVTATTLQKSDSGSRARGGAARQSSSSNGRGVDDDAEGARGKHHSEHAGPRAHPAAAASDASDGSPRITRSSTGAGSHAHALALGSAGPGTPGRHGGHTGPGMRDDDDRDDNDGLDGALLWASPRVASPRVHGHSQHGVAGAEGGHFSSRTQFRGSHGDGSLAGGPPGPGSHLRVFTGHPAEALSARSSASAFLLATGGDSTRSDYHQGHPAVGGGGLQALAPSNGGGGTHGHPAASVRMIVSAHRPAIIMRVDGAGAASEHPRARAGGVEAHAAHHHTTARARGGNGALQPAVPVAQLQQHQPDYPGPSAQRAAAQWQSGLEKSLLSATAQASTTQPARTEGLSLRQLYALPLSAYLQASVVAHSSRVGGWQRG